MSKKKKQIFQSKIEIITIAIALVAMFISLLTLYYQFYYVDKKLYMTPIYPSLKHDHDGTFQFRLVFTNSGEETITMLSRYYSFFYSVNRDGFEPFDDERVISDKALEPIVISPGNTFTIQFDVPTYYFDSNVIESDFIVFNFELIDNMGHITYLNTNACIEPIIEANTNIQYVTEYGLNISKDTCNKVIKVF